MTTAFDALIEGNLYAHKSVDGVDLYRSDPDRYAFLAKFVDEDAFSLINGYTSAAAFNDAMAKRRARTAKPKETTSA
jgi:hypothetical protein